MNIYNWINETDLNKIAKKVNHREKWEFERAVKGSANKVTVNFHSAEIDEDLAKSIWKGNRYLIHVSFDYHGKSGIGGYGYATTDYSIFTSGWKQFKIWFDGLMITFSDYETKVKEPDYQMCLFEN